MIKLLLVEDSKMDSLAIQDMLSEMRSDKLEISSAGLLSDAQEILDSTEFDIVLLDLNLPDSFGLDTLKDVLEYANGTPVIVLTGMPDEEIELEAIKLGAQDCLIKREFNSSLLKRAIRYSIRRKQAIQEIYELFKSNIELQNIVNDSPAVAFLWLNEEDFEVVFVSENIAQYGYKPEEFLSGKIKYTDIIYPDDLKAFLKEKSKIENDEKFKSGKFEYRILNSNEEIRWIEMYISVRRDEKKSITHFQGIILDITDKKTIEEQLKEHQSNLEEMVEKRTSELKSTYEKLEELSKMKEDFLGVVSHDLRSPFTAILGAAQILRRDESLSDYNKEIVEIISNSASKQLKYVSDILSIIKFEAGEMTLNKEETSLETLVYESVYLHKLLANRKNVQLDIDIPGNIKVFLDYPKISQVLNNLIANAIKFTPSKGSIIVSYFKNENNEIEFHIKDTGIGIPEEKIEDIFNMYKQFHEFGTNGEKGEGLGLAICKNLIELHGGRLYAVSEIGKGSDFFFTLPMD